MPHPAVRALAVDASGALWIGTGNGLALLRGGQITTCRFSGADPGDGDGKSRNKVRAVLPTSDGSVWIAVPTGLYRLRNEQETFFTAAPHGQGLPHSDVRALLHTRDGSLWVGTAGGGVARVTGLDAPSGLLRWTTLSTADGLSSDHVWTFHEDHDGALWIGTERGLNRLTFSLADTAAARRTAPDRQFSSRSPPANPSAGPPLRTVIQSFTTRQGLPSDLVNFIIEDDQRRLWIGHDRGIYRVRKQDIESVAAGRLSSVPCVAYDESDGMLSRETNGQRSQPAGCRTRDGRLWFATVKGVVVIDPSEIRENAVPPPVVIEQVLADGETVFANGAIKDITHPDTAGPPTPGRAPPRTSAAPSHSLGPNPPPSTLRLPPGRGRLLAIRYTANSFVQPGQVRFKHRLEGHDPDWIDDGTQRTASYSNLRPGRYRLRVIAANADGLWNQAGATLSFAISPYFYQAAWFRLACAAGLLFAAFLLYRWRLRESRRFQALEREQARAGERERIARDLHDDLGAGLQHISILSGLAERQADAGSPLGGQIRQIGQTARDSLRTLSHTIWTLEPHSASIASFATYVSEMAQRLLAPAGIRCVGDAPPSGPQAELTARVRSQLLAAVKESFQNILKHAAATEVRLQFRVEDRTFHLIIEDNGRGFDSTSPPASPPNPKS